MTWQVIDFQGIAAFEKTLAEQLDHYLDEKQSYYSQQIAESIPSEPDSANPILVPSKSQRKLSDGVEVFARKVNQAILTSSTSQEKWKTAAAKINQSLWEYSDLLQGISVELYQQLDQVGIEQWRPELLGVVEKLKDTLLHHMDDLKWAVKRLDSQLWEYRYSSSGHNKLMSKALNLLPFRKGITDFSIIKNLEKSQKFLNFRFQNFKHRYEQYIDLDHQVKKKCLNFNLTTL